MRTMQRAGFDIQICGFGLSSTYHANNEYSLLSDFQDGARTLLNVINMLEDYEKESMAEASLVARTSPFPEDGGVIEGENPLFAPEPEIFRTIWRKGRMPTWDNRQSRLSQTINLTTTGRAIS